MLGWLKKNLTEAKKHIQEEISRYKNRDFLEAVVAGCALVACADGQISSQEKQKMIGFIQNSDELKVFAVDDVIAYFNQVSSKFDFDHAIGTAEAFKTVGKLKKDEGASRLMVRVCALVASADGDFSQSEKEMISKICQELSLNPSDFDLPSQAA
jgi:tellurite resistance protein TerB